MHLESQPFLELEYISITVALNADGRRCLGAWFVKTDGENRVKRMPVLLKTVHSQKALLESVSAVLGK